MTEDKQCASECTSEKSLPEVTATESMGEFPEQTSRPLTDLIHGSVAPCGATFGPIPDLFRWLYGQHLCLERGLTQDPASVGDPRVEVALTKQHQNLEIVLQHGQYYFEVSRTFRVSLSGTDSPGGKTGERPRAWFSFEVERKLLLKPAKTWLNGSHIFYCLLCNHFSPHAHHMVLHMMFCQKELPQHKWPVDTHTTPTRPPTHKPRSFDIISLLKSDHSGLDSANTPLEEEEEIRIDVESLEDEPQRGDQSVFRAKRGPQRSKGPAKVIRRKGIKLGPARSVSSAGRSAFGRPKSQPESSQSLPKGPESNLLSNLGLAHLYTHLQGSLHSPLDALLPASHFPSGPDPAHLLSAGGYPLLTNNTATAHQVAHIENRKSDGTDNPARLNSLVMSHFLLHSASATVPNQASPAGHCPSEQRLAPRSPPLLDTSSSSSSSDCHSPKVDKVASKGDKPGATQSKAAECSVSPPSVPPYGSGSGTNPLLSSLYLLSPSLSALSYQASNVCAYCNTAFRMTSDLVYHMRSHHKSAHQDVDCGKKRKGDQLRCHICNETFRERHHLTRHMTSHQ